MSLGLLILLTLAVSFNAAAAAQTPRDNSSNSTNPMDLSTADNLEENFTDPAEFTIDDNITADTTGVVLQTRNYTCGPAALATLLQKLGINTTEDELADLAGTTEDGTTMQGLLEAAKAKGVNMTGMKLNITELHENMIAYTMSDGVGHYTLIREVNNETVKLADPTMGNIEMSLEEFQEIYTGYALIIKSSDNTEAMENRTASDNQTEHEMNPMNISTDQPIQGTDSAKILSTEEMQNIRGKLWWLPITLYGLGNIIVTVRDKYVPRKYWKYCAYHPPNKRVKAYLGRDHCIHYVEY